jgi:hypothetical protein
MQTLKKYWKMTPKTKLLQRIEDYCMGSLDQTAKREFETELKQNQYLKEEYEFECEIQGAISEQDIVKLRDKLKSIAKQDITASACFDLLEGFENIQPLTKTIPPEELLKFYDSLPKAHVYQHELIANENIHEFFREQSDAELNDDFIDDEIIEPDTGDEFDGLEEAVLEKDILKLRDTLSKVAEVNRKPGILETIDRYLNGELEGYELEGFEDELAGNSILQRELKLHDELESAVKEIDIMNLKDRLSRLLETENSYGVNEKQIEDYIGGELEGKDLDAFRSELHVNTGLRSELNLRKKVEKAIREKNVIALRDKLLQAKKEVTVKESKSIVPDKKIRHIHYWRAGVAVAIVLFAFAGIFRNNQSSYEEHFQPPKWSPQRSVDANAGILQQANSHFIHGEYDKAISLYDKAILENRSENFVFHFYKAACLQDLGKFEKAIDEYSQVIKQGDNMFIEEAEWYKTLCNLKLGKNDEAKRQLRYILKQNGFYANDARAILRKNKFSFR